MYLSLSLYVHIYIYIHIYVHAQRKESAPEAVSNTRTFETKPVRLFAPIASASHPFNMGFTFGRTSL